MLSGGCKSQEAALQLLQQPSHLQGRVDRAGSKAKHLM
jgi:hypothetical protein